MFAGELGAGIEAHGETSADIDNGNSPSKPGNRMGRLLGSWFGSADKPAVDVAEPSILELFGRSLDTVQETITRLKLAAQPPDLLITIPRNASTFYDFHRAETLIEIGRLRARQALARWSPAGTIGRSR